MSENSCASGIISTPILRAGRKISSIRQTYLAELEASDLYIGVFWQRYGQYTIDEYEHAQRLGKERLVYEKRTRLKGRDPRLHFFTFLDPPADFTGRQPELDALLAKFQPSGDQSAAVGPVALGHLAAITGLTGGAGLGKTALARLLAHHLKDRSPAAPSISTSRLSI